MSAELVTEDHEPALRSRSTLISVEVGRLIHGLAADLGPAIDSQMRTVHEAGNEWFAAITRGWRSRDEPVLSDFAVQLDLLRRCWSELTRFTDEDLREDADLVKGIRNKWAHTDTLTDDDLALIIRFDKAVRPALDLPLDHGPHGTSSPASDPETPPATASSHAWTTDPRIEVVRDLQEVLRSQALGALSCLESTPTDIQSADAIARAAEAGRSTVWLPIAGIGPMVRSPSGALLDLRLLITQMAATGVTQACGVAAMDTPMLKASLALGFAQDPIATRDVLHGYLSRLAFEIDQNDHGTRSWAIIQGDRAAEQAARTLVPTLARVSPSDCELDQVVSNLFREDFSSLAEFDYLAMADPFRVGERAAWWLTKVQQYLAGVGFEEVRANKGAPRWFRQVVRTVVKHNLGVLRRSGVDQFGNPWRAQIPIPALAFDSMRRSIEASAV